jgi:DNA repair exonuclease SbcCD ATPase subunit
MADTSTKSIATRVPIDTYIKIVKDASDRKMTLSDYLFIRLLNEGDQSGPNSDPEKGKMIESLQKQIKELQNAQKGTGNTTDSKELAKARKEIKKLEEKVAEQLTSIRSKNGTVVNRDQIIRDYQKEIKNLASQLQMMSSKLEGVDSDYKLKLASANSNYKSLEVLSSAKQKEIERLKKDVEKLKLEADGLKADVTRYKKLADTKDLVLNQVSKTNQSIKQELEDYNDRNRGFFSGDPIGEEFMEKISGLLTKHF